MNTDIAISSIRNYRERVENAATRKSKLIFPNSTAIHANIVMTNILNNAKKTVCIYDSNLSGDIANLFNNPELSFLVEEHKKAIINFVKEKKTLKIIVKKIDEESHFLSFLLNLQAEYANNIILKSGNQQLSADVKKEFGQDINFTVGDNRIFRQEQNDKTNVRNAICSFNNKLFARR